MAIDVQFSEPTCHSLSSDPICRQNAVQCSTKIAPPPGPDFWGRDMEAVGRTGGARLAVVRRGDVGCCASALLWVMLALMPPDLQDLLVCGWPAPPGPPASSVPWHGLKSRLRASYGSLVACPNRGLPVHQQGPQLRGACCDRLLWQPARRYHGPGQLGVQEALPAAGPDHVAIGKRGPAQQREHQGIDSRPE